MIRTLIVDDDFMAVSVHRAFLTRIPGFEVVGEATTGARALELVEELRPDLVVLDMYLPDIPGSDVLQRIRASSHRDVDVIAITSAKDVDILRNAMRFGVVQYIVKPFTFGTFQERFERYASVQARMQAMQEPGQGDVDRVYGLLRTAGEDALPKGIAAPTLDVVSGILRDSVHGVSATELAEQAGFSAGVARRYLRFLSKSGSVTFTVRYGAAGRPEHIYRWSR
ncbi:MAG: response regulator [Candidatus Nanopelagicales bacterium]